MVAGERKPNRLADATSPYLLQHAGNPVDWYEWGQEALERAGQEEKPILLSVGYAACHWCHVMERESFEDPETARVMNEHFVSIKVDREERPDVDALYMDAVQTMTGHGGWPMTVFLTPEGRPFYAGTYFPPEDRHGMPAFRKVLDAVARAWEERREELGAQGARVVEAIAQNAAGRASGQPLTEDVLREAHQGLTQAFDAEWGGFGSAPKFPQPMALEFLLRAHLRGFPRSLEMVTLTLDKMASGGIYDQAGGGFHRYSTDRTWLVPHFEKMLYDNTQLARLYLHAWQITGDDSYRGVAVATLEYLLREMRHEDGGFFSAQDADTDGEEGKYYVWRWDELVSVVGEDGARALGATPEGNWEGVNILTRSASPRDTTDLLEHRMKRRPPATDDKVLACWNGLAIIAFAEAGRALPEPRYVEAAEQAGRFILEELRREDGRLLRAWREGRTSGPGYVDDYAMVAVGCLALYETTFDVDWMREALGLADEMIRLFHDPDGGGFFHSGSDAERLVVRGKEFFDNAIPSGNSVAAEVLQRLALLTGEPRYEQAGVSALRIVRDYLTRAPTMFGHSLGALDLYLADAREVAVLGDLEAAETRQLLTQVWEGYRPNIVFAASNPEDREASKVVPLLAGKTALNGRPAAYVCERFTCKQPVSDPASLAAELG